jgi:hypothetical protein
MLTPKQERFLAAYLESGNASEAYRRAYDAKGMKPETVNRAAFALLGNAKIAARLAALRATAEAKALLSFEQHMDRLQRLSEKAEAGGNWSELPCPKQQPWRTCYHILRLKRHGLVVRRYPRSKLTKSPGSLVVRPEASHGEQWHEIDAMS